MSGSATDRAGERLVLMLIGGGIVTIILSIIGAMVFAHNMPDWAEGVLNVIAGGALVKLADVLSALVALSNGRQFERVTDQLSEAMPAGKPPPTDAIDAARQVENAAADEADRIAGEGA